MAPRFFLHHLRHSTGRGPAVGRLVWDQEVGSSNLPAPTKFSSTLSFRAPQASRNPNHLHQPSFLFHIHHPVIPTLRRNPNYFHQPPFLFHAFQPVIPTL